MSRGRTTTSHIILFILLVLGTGSTSLRAQTYNWQRLWNFPSPVITIKFFSFEPQLTVGYAGLDNGDIWMSTNNGNTWSLTFSPNNCSVSAITFKDESTGWASAGIHTSNNAGKTHGCYRTTNGGNSWLPLRTDQNFYDINYQSATGRLYAVGEDSLYVSIDEGNTWQGQVAGGFNSVAFTNKDQGIVSTFDKTGYLYTTDGGFSWNRTRMTSHCWSPLPLSSTNQIYAASEIDAIVFRSDDGGIHWDTVAFVGPTAPTGDMEGDECQLFYQGSGSAVEVSYDGGYHWQQIGGPNTFYDTRFCVNEERIYAADDEGNLFSAPRLKSVLASPSALSLPSLSSCSEIDTAIYVFNSVCDSITVLSVHSNDSAHCAILTPPLPKRLAAGAFLRIPMHITPGTPGSVTTSLEVQYWKDADTLTMMVPVRYTATEITKPTLVLSTKQLIFSTKAICSDSSALFIIKNPLCVPISLDSIFWDSTLTDLSFSHDTSKHLLKPNQTDSIRVTYQPHHTSFGITTLHVRMSQDSYSNDTTLKVAVSSYLLPFTSERDTLDLGVLRCHDSMTTLTIPLRYCDTLWYRLSSIKNSGFTVESSANDTAVVDSLTLLVSFHADSAATFTDSIQVAFMTRDSSTQQTTIILVARVSKSANILSLPATLDLGTLPLCSTRDTALTLHNLSICDSLQLLSYSITGSGWTSVALPLSAPITLAANDSIAFKLHSSPVASDSNNGGIAVDTLHLHFASFDTVIVVRAQGTSPATSLDEVTPAKFTAPLCDSSSYEVIYINPTCDAITIDSVTFEAATGVPIDDLKHFGIGSVTLPVTLSRGDTLRFDVTFNGTLDSIISSRSGKLRLHTTDNLHTKSSTLTCTTYETRTFVSFNVQSVDHKNQLSVPAGEYVHVIVTPKATIDSTLGVTSIHLILNYNSDILTLDTLIAKGWRITVLDSTHGLNVLIERDRPTTFWKDSTILDLAFYVTISTEASTPLTITQLTFNPSQQQFSQCILVNTPQLDTAQMTVLQICADETIRRFMNGENVLHFMSLQPNPLSKDQTLHYSLQSKEAAEASVDVLDLLGHVVMSNSLVINKGITNTELDIHHLPSGEYFLRISSNSAIGTQKFIVK